MKAAAAEHWDDMRQATALRSSWDLPGARMPANQQGRSKSLALSTGGELRPTSRSEEEPSEQRRWLDDLEEQINAQHDQVAALMHERNAQPEDKEVATRLQRAFDHLRALQRKYVDQMRTSYQPPPGMPSREDSERVKQALKFLEEYESTPTDDAAARDPVRSKS